MKKIITWLLAVILCLSLTLGMAACGKQPLPSDETPQDETPTEEMPQDETPPEPAVPDHLREFGDALRAAGNDCKVQLTILKINNKPTEALSVTIELTGHVQYLPASRQYISAEADGEYIYVYNHEFFTYSKVKNTSGESASDLTPEMLQEFFNADNFDQDKKNPDQYRQKKDVAFETLEDVAITVEGDTVTVFATVLYRGVSIREKIVFSDVGKMKVELPD